MRCSDVEALWDEMRGGVEPGREHVLVHLRRCTTCQELYREFEGVAYCLSCLPLVEPPENLVPRIMDHIRTMRGRMQRAEVPDEIGRVPSPLGDLYVAWRSDAITFLGIDRGEEFDVVRRRVERRLRRPVHAADVPGWLIHAVARFFKTWSLDESRTDISALTTFEQAALRKAAQIPPGEVRSYSWIAREIGKPLAARAVGQAMARNPIALLYPCHRVVDASGSLHNYGYGIELKARILQMEGYRKG
jgi:O-6-methylguanine DNA methyltransferase